MAINWTLDPDWIGGSYWHGDDLCVWFNSTKNMWEWAMWTPIIRKAKGSSMSQRLGGKKGFISADDAKEDAEHWLATHKLPLGTGR